MAKSFAFTLQTQFHSPNLEQHFNNPSLMEIGIGSHLPVGELICPFVFAHAKPPAASQGSERDGSLSRSPPRGSTCFPCWELYKSVLKLNKCLMWQKVVWLPCLWEVPIPEGGNKEKTFMCLQDLGSPLSCKTRVLFLWQPANLALCLKMHAFFFFFKERKSWCRNLEW